jgi:hypothetical protein
MRATAIARRMPPSLMIQAVDRMPFAKSLSLMLHLDESMVDCALLILPDQKEVQTQSRTTASDAWR